MAFDREIYPNSPLLEVVCELRFSGELAVECHRDRFWDKIRSDYPHILVPPMQERNHPSLIPYRFEREDHKAGIMVAVNRLAMFAREYPGVDVFRTEFLRIHKVFSECFPSVSVVNRAGWRYINVIPFLRGDGGTVPVGEFLRVSLVLPEGSPSSFEALSTKFSAHLNNVQYIVKLETVEKDIDEGQEDALRLDIDCGLHGPIDFAAADEHVDTLHTASRQLFEDLITDEYRQYLRGEAYDD